jgi:hypothetical protein
MLLKNKYDRLLFPFLVSSFLATCYGIPTQQRINWIELSITCNRDNARYRLRCYNSLVQA